MIKAESSKKISNALYLLGLIPIASSLLAIVIRFASGSLVAESIIGILGIILTIPALFMLRKGLGDNEIGESINALITLAIINIVMVILITVIGEKPGTESSQWGMLLTYAVLGIVSLYYFLSRYKILAYFTNLQGMRGAYKYMMMTIYIIGVVIALCILLILISFVLSIQLDKITWMIEGLTMIGGICLIAIAVACLYMAIGMLHAAAFASKHEVELYCEEEEEDANNTNKDNNGKRALGGQAQSVRR